MKRKPFFTAVAAVAAVALGAVLSGCCSDCCGTVEECETLTVTSCDPSAGGNCTDAPDSGDKKSVAENHDGSKDHGTTTASK